MKKLFIVLFAIVLVACCSKKYTTNVIESPITVSPMSDSIEDIIKEENVFKLLQSSLPLTKGLTCTVAKFTSIPSTLLTSLPTIVKVSYTYMENQRDLVEVVAQLKQIMCIKG